MPATSVLNRSLSISLNRGDKNADLGRVRDPTHPGASGLVLPRARTPNT